MSPDDWDRVIQVNLSGAFYLIRAVLQHMLDRSSGRIINISSIIGESGNIGQANYAAAKAGLFGLTMSLAQETARKGITVNSVEPGYVATEMVAAVPKPVAHLLRGWDRPLPDMALGAKAKMTVLGGGTRVGPGEEVWAQARATFERFAAASPHARRGDLHERGVGACRRPGVGRNFQSTYVGGSRRSRDGMRELTLDDIDLGGRCITLAGRHDRLPRPGRRGG